MDKADKEELELVVKKLQAEISNLRVQNADYSQIVQELSDKINPLVLS